MRKLLSLLLFYTLLLPVVHAQDSKTEQKLNWQDWSEQAFAEAKKTNKFVILDLEAIWCHWCHVMAETTYQDAAVVELMQKKYITIRVDQDSRPDLSNRYANYGWPATIVFGPDGQEIIKRSGYIAPKNMVSLLQAIIDDPSPGPSVRPDPQLEFPVSPYLSTKLTNELRANLLSSYDFKQGSWGDVHKLLEWNSTEYVMTLARAGDRQAEQMARQTLDAQRKLLDPAWGGVYQYSAEGDWAHPHFEKVMAMQAENLRIYALAFAQFHDEKYLFAATEIQRFLNTFLTSPDGAFYTSQDADLVQGEHAGEYFLLSDSERRKQGILRVDTHIYARENGWVIDGLTALYAATNDAQYLDSARRAADWIVANRALNGGGFRHDEQDVAGPYLGDTLAMGRAFLSLYTVTAEQKWLQSAEQAAAFIQHNFAAKSAGFLTSKTATDAAYTPQPLREENIALARFANLLFHYTGDAAYKTIAEQAMLYLASPQIAGQLPSGGILLANLELSSEPVHITIVGHKDDDNARALFSAALHYPGGFKRVEWWDKREGNLQNPDVQYPELKKAAAFACTENRCSLPVFEADGIQEQVDRLGKKFAEQDQLSALKTALDAQKGARLEGEIAAANH